MDWEKQKKIWNSQWTRKDRKEFLWWLWDCQNQFAENYNRTGKEGRKNLYDEVRTFDFRKMTTDDILLIYVSYDEYMYDDYEKVREVKYKLPVNWYSYLF